MKKTFALLCLLALLGIPRLHAQPANQPATNHVLSFEGSNGCVVLPANLLEGLDAVTIEAWVKWDRLPSGFIPLFVYGQNGHGIYLVSMPPGMLWLDNTLTARWSSIRRDFVLRTNQWLHFAATVDTAGSRLLINGVLAGTHGNAGTLASSPASPKCRLGNWEPDVGESFRGQMDEIRIWNRRLSEAEIRQRMFQQMISKEPGLIACWNFEPGASSEISPPTEWFGSVKISSRAFPEPQNLIGYTLPEMWRNPLGPAACYTLLTVALICSLLFLFAPQFRLSLYVALFAAASCLRESPLRFLDGDTAWRLPALVAVVAAWMLSALRLVYCVFNHTLPRRFWLLLAAWVAVAVCSQASVTIGVTSLNFYAIYLLMAGGVALATSLEMFYVTIRTIFRREKAVLTMVVGVALFYASLLWFILVRTLAGVDAWLFDHFGLQYDVPVSIGQLGFVACCCLWLARSFAKADSGLRLRTAELAAATADLERKNLQLAQRRSTPTPRIRPSPNSSRT